MNRNNQIIGTIFNNWKVEGYSRSNKNGDALWLIRCINCNQLHQKAVTKTQLSGNIRCIKCSPTKRSLKKHFTSEQLVNRRHGLKYQYQKEYWAWQGMKQRCLNPNDEKYELYGARGIKVCKEWITSFKQFLQDIGPAPGKEFSIDRIDSDGDYVKSNVRWATIVEQNSHLRRGKC
jgi:hypothetical protein